VVTSTRTEPSDSRAFTGSGPKAENIGQYTAPAASVPSTVAYKGGMRPMSVATRSPRCTPKVVRTFATRRASAASSR
jgi:hypothetical protein